MGSFSVWHWLIVLAVVLLLFGGRGKISQRLRKRPERLQEGRRGEPRRDASGPAGPAAGRRRKADLGTDHDDPAWPGSPGQRRQGLTGPPAALSVSDRV